MVLEWLKVSRFLRERRQEGSKVMFAQLANTILHGVRIFDEAAKNTMPTEMNRPMIATRNGADIIAVRTPTRKETTMTFDDENKPKSQDIPNTCRRHQAMKLNRRVMVPDCGANATVV